MRSSRGMTGSSIFFGDTILRSGRRLFATQNLVDHEKQETEINLGETDVGNDGGEETEINLMATNQGMGISGEQKEEIKLGESKDFMDRNHDDGTKKFRAVYTRKRKRTVELESYNSNFKLGKFEKYSRNKKRTSLGSTSFNSDSGFDGKNGFLEGPIMFVGPSSSCIYRFSCFVSSVLRYIWNANKVFSWRHFSSFLSSDPTASIYTSNGCRFPKDSICHGFFKVFGSIHSIPFFTVDFNALPTCFLYMHSSSLLKSAFLSYALIVHPIVENVKRDSIKVPYFLATDSDQPIGYFVVAIKARSVRTRVVRVLVFKESFPVRVQDLVPVPSVREVSGYAEEEYMGFVRPLSYINFRDDEVTRALDKSYAIYDMDSVDEEWLKRFNKNRERVSEDSFEKIIGALERGMYCSRDISSDTASAVDQCLGLASTEVVQAVHRYWMKKRKRNGSPLVRVFQCNPRKRGRKPVPVAVVRKKRSFRGRNRQAINKDENALEEEPAKARAHAHETQEAATRAEAAAIVKREEAQALMEVADRAVYRATMFLRIAELRGAAHNKKKEAEAINGNGNGNGNGSDTGTGKGTGSRGRGPRPMCVLGLRCVRASMK